MCEGGRGRTAAESAVGIGADDGRRDHGVKVLNPVQHTDYARHLCTGHVAYECYSCSCSCCCYCRLEAAVIDTYIADDKSVLTPDVGGSGNTHTFTEAVCSRL